MDYGQGRNTRNLDDDLFSSGITSGVGTASDNYNPDIKGSIHSTDENMSWNGENNDAKPQNYREIGNSAISSNNIEPNGVLEPNRPINLEAPPAPEDIPFSPVLEESTVQKENPETIEEKTVGIKTAEHLNESGIRAIEKATQKLNQDGNIADFYTRARDMMEQNLENSYGRKLAA